MGLGPPPGSAHLPCSVRSLLLESTLTLSGAQTLDMRPGVLHSPGSLLFLTHYSLKLVPADLSADFLLLRAMPLGPVFTLRC